MVGTISLDCDGDVAWWKGNDMRIEHTPALARAASGDYPRPGHPGGPGNAAWDSMNRAIHGATPTSFSVEHEAALTTMAIDRGWQPGDAASVIRSTYGATPTAFDGRDNAIVMGAALLANTEPGSVGSVVRGVYGATPTSFGSSQNTAVMAIALLARVGSDAGSIVRQVYGRTPSSYTPDQNAAAMMGELIARGGNRHAAWEFERLLREIR